MSIIFSFQRILVDRVHASLGLVQLRYKRRRVNPPPWVPPMYYPIRSELYKPDRALIEKLLKEDPEWQPPSESKFEYEDANFHLIPGVPNPPDCTHNQYSIENSKRIGLVGRKLGMTLQWLSNGKRCLCTLIHVPDNHVLSANDPETWYLHSITGRQKAFRGVVTRQLKVPPRWSQMVGAQDFDSVFLTAEYRRMFERAGVPCKEFMAGFVVSEDAIVKPGTKLDVRHFKVGQHITVSGKSIDWGFQGVMHRWGMKGQMNKRIGTTKAHRRVGAIGGKGEAKVWPGRRLPGHMGYDWTHVPGLKVLRINPIKQVIYVLGNVPGDNNEWLLLKDCFVEEKLVEDPPFPTFYPPEAEFLLESEQQQLGLGGEMSLQQPITVKTDSDEWTQKNRLYAISSQDLYDPSLHQFTQPSIVYTEKDETKFTKRDKTRAKTAKIKK